MGLKLLPERPKANDTGICSTLEPAAPGPQPKPRQIEGIAGGEVVNNRRQAPRPAVMRDCPAGNARRIVKFSALNRRILIPRGFALLWT